LNCRRVSNLLSAYVDKELAGAEMLEIRAHLSRCSHCQSEHDQLQQTKQLLGALALRAPRDPDRYEALLLRTITEQEARQGRTSSLLGWLPDLFETSRLRQQGGMPGRLRTAGVAFALSLAGLFAATTTPLDRIIVGNDSTPDGVRARQGGEAPLPRMAARELRASYGIYDIYNAPSHIPPVPASGTPVLTDPQPLPLARHVSASSVLPIGYDAFYRRPVSGPRLDQRPAYAGYSVQADR